MRNHLNINILTIIALWVVSQASCKYSNYEAINFTIKDCIGIGYSDTNVKFGCNSNFQVGTPSQTMKLTFILDQPQTLNINENNLNMLINDQCTQKNKCKYYNGRNGDSPFYSENSSTKVKQDKKVDLFLKGKRFIQGQYQSDLFSLFKNDEQLHLEFLSVSYLDLPYLSNGVVSLERNNRHNIFLKGYQQGIFASPKFVIHPSFDSGNLSFQLTFNQIPSFYNNLPMIPTKTPRTWSISILGIYLEEENIISITHYQSVQISLTKQVSIPTSLAKYLKKKYSIYFKENTNELKNCFDCACACLQNKIIPDITIYTEEYKFQLSPQQFFKSSTLKCELLHQNGPITVGLSFLYQHPAVFNPEEGSLAFFNAEQIKHQDVIGLQFIFGGYFLILIKLLIFLFIMERKSSILNNERISYIELKEQ